MKIAFPAIVVLFVQVTQAAEPPKWTAMTELFGQSKDAKVITDFVETHKLREATKGPSGSFTAHDQSYTLMYRASRVGTLILRVSPFPEGYGEADWKPYAGQLPAGLTPQHSRKAVIKQFGEPIESRRNTWKHDGFYVWIHFNESQTAINEIFISHRVIEAKAS